MYYKIMKYLEDTTYPEKYKMFAALSCTSAFLSQGKVYWSETIKHKMYPNLFVVFVGSPGSGKSITSNLAYHIITDYNKKHFEGESKLVPEALKLIPSAGATSAGVLDYLRTYCVRPMFYPEGEESVTSGYLISSELSVLIGGAKHGNILSDFIDMHDSLSSFSKHLAGAKDQSIPTPIPVLLACTTPQYWFEDIPDNIISDGFCSRTLLIYTDEFIERPAFAPKGDWKLFNEVVKDAERISALEGEFQIAPDALKWFVNYFNAETNRLRLKYDKIAGIWNSYTQRRNNQLIKLGMIVSASRNSSLVIQKEDFEEARGFLLQVESNLDALTLRRDIRFNKSLAARVANAVDREPKTIEGIQNSLGQMGYVADPMELQRVLTALVQQGAIMQIKDTYKKVAL